VFGLAFEVANSRPI